MRFHSRSYQTLPSIPDGRILGELTLAHIHNNPGGASAYTGNCDAPDVAYHLIDEGEGMSLDKTPQFIPVNIVRLDGTPAPTDHYMVDLFPHSDGWDPTAIDTLSSILMDVADVFSSSKVKYGEFSLRLFEIEVPPDTQPIQSRSNRLNPVLSKQVEAIPDSYISAILILHSTFPWSSLLVCVPNTSGGISSPSTTKN